MAVLIDSQYTDIMSIRSRLTIIFLAIVLIAFHPTTAVTNESTLDLAITALDTAPSGAPGSPLSTTFTVENKGSRISMTDKVTVYLSPDPEITGADYPVGETEISFIRPGVSREENLIGTIPTDIKSGTYYAGAVLTTKFDLIKEDNQENNVFTGNRVNVTNQYVRPQEWYNNRISDLVFTYTNEERKKRNLNELKRDKALDIIAQEDSDDMAKRQFFEHTNPDGEDPIARAERHGYNQLRYLPDGTKFYGVGENIVKIPIGTVYQFGNIVPDDPDQIASVAVKSFMDSISHKTTLLLPEFEVIGVGTSFDGKYYYINQNFF